MSVYLHEILDYAHSMVEEFRDNQTGEINLTELEEDVQDHFNLTDLEVENADLSFKIFKHLEKLEIVDTPERERKK